jgi:hypothetical protein
MLLLRHINICRCGNCYHLTARWKTYVAISILSCTYSVRPLDQCLTKYLIWRLRVVEFDSLQLMFSRDCPEPARMYCNVLDSTEQLGIIWISNPANYKPPQIVKPLFDNQNCLTFDTIVIHCVKRPQSPFFQLRVIFKVLCYSVSICRTQNLDCQLAVVVILTIIKPK